MKQLMLGNEAVARGLYEAGCSFVSSYPGTPSTEITEYAAKYKEIYAEWAPNEKVAVEAAFGACVAGKRSFCSMKHVGLNVAADPVFTISYTGVNAGMIIGVADDAGMHSSQNEQDSRHYAIAAKLPMLEPADAGESLSFTKLAYEISEKYDTPVFIKMCTRVAHSQSVIETSDRVETSKTYEKNGAKYIMMPGNAKRRHPIVEARTAALTEYAETAPFNRIEDGSDHSIGIITSSTSYQYAKEVCGDKYPVLKIGMINPLPVKKIQDFAFQRIPRRSHVRNDARPHGADARHGGLSRRGRRCAERRKNAVSGGVCPIFRHLQRRCPALRGRDHSGDRGIPRGTAIKARQPGSRAHLRGIRPRLLRAPGGAGREPLVAKIRAHGDCQAGGHVRSARIGGDQARHGQEGLPRRFRQPRHEPGDAQARVEALEDDTRRGRQRRHTRPQPRSEDKGRRAQA